MYLSLSIMADTKFLSLGVIINYLFCLISSNIFLGFCSRYLLLLAYLLYTGSRVPWKSL